MFTVDWIEKYFSRVRPWHVVLIWGPYTAWLLAHGARDGQLSRAALLGMFALGVFGWTFLEYVLHRWVFHFKPDPNAEWQRDASWLIGPAIGVESTMPGCLAGAQRPPRSSAAATA